MTSAIDEFDLDIRIGTGAPRPSTPGEHLPYTYTGDSVCDSCGTTISMLSRKEEHDQQRGRVRSGRSAGVGRPLAEP